MQENVNIPDSNITANLTFRQLVLMNMQQLTNFPYIEKDFDALTDYELLCLVVKFLNDVIANQNEQNDSITSMYNAFLSLQSYVNNTKDTLEDAFNTLDNYVRNYFANLDVQDEIDHKLDEYVEDGTLEHIIASYLQTQKIYNTHTEMVADASNLVNGLTVQTLGYSSLNDGGGAFYKITDTESLTEYQEEVGDLFATIITQEEMNALQFGLVANSDLSTFDFSLIPNVRVFDLKFLTFECSDSVTLPSNFKLKNGKIVSAAINSLVIATKENIVLENIHIDGNNVSERGFHITYSKNIILDNCIAEKFKLDSLLTCGIYLNRCEYVTIQNTIVKDIGNTSTGVDEDHVVRGIEIGNTLYCTVDKCYVQNVYDSTKSHGDGIHFLAQTTLIGIISNNKVTNTTVDSCAYRCIKIQQYGVTIDSNNLINSDETLETKQSNIAVYDNNTTIKNNKITHKSYVPIMVGVVNDNTTKITNTIIDGNYIEHSGSHYQGIITIPTNSELVKNLIISNNILKATSDTEDGVLLFSSFENVQVINNVFDNVINGVFDRTPGSYSYTVKRNYLTVNGNNGVVRNNLVYIDNTDTTFVVITGNNISYSNMLSADAARNVVRVTNSNLGELKKYIIGNNKLSDNIWDGWRKVGNTAQRPTSSAYDGFIYYDVTLHQNVTFYNGSWYLPDGSVSS